MNYLHSIMHNETIRCKTLNGSFS